VQIAIVGSGSIGQRHVRNIRSLRQSQDDITIIRRKSSTGKVIRDLRAYPDREEFQLHDRVAYADTPEEIPLDKFDLLFVCNPTSFHCEWVLADSKPMSRSSVRNHLPHPIRDLSHFYTGLTGKIASSI